MPQSYYNQDVSASVAALDATRYESYLIKADAALGALKARYNSKELALFGLPEKTSDLEAIESIAERFCENFDDVIVLGR